jgi:hypothetical protein
MAFLDPKKLAAAGFTDIIEDRRACGVFSVTGFDKAGKTHFCFTAPGPIGYQACDFGDEGVIQKFRDKQVIRPSDPKTGKPREYHMEVPDALDKPTEKEQNAKGAEKASLRRTREAALADYVEDNFVKPWREDYRKLLDLGVRTVIWDTATEAWKWVRISVYGRGATNRSDLQTIANAKWREMVRAANLRNVNLFLIQQLKQKFVAYEESGETKWKPSPTGEVEADGNEKNPFLVTAGFITRYYPPAFRQYTREREKEGYFEIEVVTSRDEPSQRGERYQNVSFPEIMAFVMPDVPMESWE